MAELGHFSNVGSGAIVVAKEIVEQNEKEASKRRGPCLKQVIQSRADSGSLAILVEMPCNVECTGYYNGS
jgi:hypothetical protein